MVAMAPLASLFEKWRSRQESKKAIKQEQRLIDLLSATPFALETLRKEEITGRIVDAAIANSGLAIRFVPPELITQQRLEAAVTENPRALHLVPQEHISLEMAIGAIQRLPTIVEAVPPALRCEQLWCVLIKANPFEIERVPIEQQTRDLAVTYALQPDVSIQQIVQNIRPDLQSLEVYAYCFNRLSSMTVKDYYYPEGLKAALHEFKQIANPPPIIEWAQWDGGVVNTSNVVDQASAQVLTPSFVKAVMSYGVEHSIICHCETASIEELFEIALTDSPWGSPVIHFEAMIRLLNFGIDRIAPYAKDETGAAICRALFGTKQTLSHVKTRQSRQWLCEDLGI